MTITIKSKDNTTPVLFTTVNPSDSGDKITGSFFDEQTFGLQTAPIWQTNYSVNRRGGYKHFHGQRDGVTPVLLHLTGTTRFRDLQTWRNIAGGTVLYLNHDTDSNLNKNFIIASLTPSYFETSRRIELNMSWEEYNN